MCSNQSTKISPAVFVSIPVPLHVNLNFKLTLVILAKSKTKYLPPVRTSGSIVFAKIIEALRRNGPPHKYHGLRNNASPIRAVCAFDISPK